MKQYKIIILWICLVATTILLSRLALVSIAGRDWEKFLPLTIPRNILLILGLIALIIVIILGYIFNWSWTGVSGYTPPDKKYQRGKTLWDWMQLLLIPLFIAGEGAMMPDGSMLESLSSIGTAAPISTKAAPLTAVDWANFTYVSSCYGSAHSFTAQNGLAISEHIHLEIYPPVFGDLTRDGQPEAIIRYSCSSADFGGVRAFVYTGNKTHPILLGDLPLPVQHRDSGEWIVNQVRINNEIVQLKGETYSLVAARCCPDQQFEASYRWDGVRFVTTHFATTSL